MKKISFLTCCVLLVASCTKKAATTLIVTPDPPAYVDTITFADSNMNYTSYGTTGTNMQCYLHRAGGFNFYSMRIDATPTFPIKILTGYATGSKDGIGRFKVAPADSSIDFQLSGANVYEELYTPGGYYNIDSSITNITYNDGTIMKSIYTIYVSNSTGSRHKSVSGIVRYHFP